MDISHLLARILGIMMIVLYGGFLINQKFYQQIGKDMVKNPIFLLLSGFISLLCGLLIIQIHPFWVLNWTILITLLGWILILNGICRLVFPEHVLKLSHKLMDRHLAFVNGGAVVMFLIGLYLSYIGFFS